ncbi:MAG TPA: methyl-accepting chemotaxis protein [Thermodesulfovibrionales bacterium]|nr:methyl-accepting chemotaxis protein [Thermodesulfovibrionales bacterium]
MKIRGSVAPRFIFVVLMVLVVGQSSLWTWFLYWQKTNYAVALENKVSATGNLLATFSKSAIMSNNYSHLDQYIDAIARDGDMISIRVTDKRGNVLREKQGQRETRGIYFNPFYIPWSSSFRSPIGGGGESYGDVEIIYSGRKLNEYMKKLLTIWPVAQIVVFACVICAIYLSFQEAVGRPVQEINETLARVTSGDLTVTVPELGDNEMGTIGRGIGFLVERLTRTIARSHSISGNVAMGVEQLTVALRNMNENARKQSKAIDDVVAAIRVANVSQKKVKENTDKLSTISSENVASLLEMKSTAEEIASSTVRLFRSTEDFYAMVAEMSQIAMGIADNAKDAFHAVENTTASAEEISVSLSEVLENAKKSAGFASDVQELTGSGTLAVTGAIEAMEEILQEVNHSSGIIMRLHERSRSIEKILSVIKEVTESTNLLSLNAAILAAQAGEYGKSFAVVADEMRALSDRTSSSARDIAGIVRTIQTEINEAAASIRVGVQKVEAGKDLIFNAGATMDGMLDAVKKSVQMAEVIEKATGEQTTGLRQITLSMENVRDMIEHAARSTEEQRKGSSHMLEGISDIKEVAEVVKRGTEEHAAGTSVISRNLEETFEMAAKISKSSEEQLKINDGIVVTVEEIKNASTAAATDMEEVTISFDTLKNEIEYLKREIGVFKIHLRTEAKGEG